MAFALGLEHKCGRPDEKSKQTTVAEQPALWLDGCPRGTLGISRSDEARVVHVSMVMVVIPGQTKTKKRVADRESLEQLRQDGLYLESIHKNRVDLRA